MCAWCRQIDMQTKAFAMVLTAVLLVGAIGAVPVGALSDDGGGLTYAANDTAPGEQFSGSVSVGEAEIENDVERRAFGHRLANASNDSERAAVIAETLENNEKRLEELRTQRESLKTAYENGDVSKREYRVRTAKLAAQLSGVEGMANKSESAAGNIPDETLAANGVDADRIERLRSNANELRGGEVSEIAQTIAGPNAGGPPGERPEKAANRSEAGGPDERENGGSDAAEDRGGSSDGENGTNRADGTDTMNSTETTEDSDAGGSGGSDDSTKGTDTDSGPSGTETEDETATETEQSG